jgi:hypothetical protein
VDAVAPRYVLSNPAALRFACGCPRITQAHHTAGETTSSTWTPAPAALKTEDDARHGRLRRRCAGGFADP